MVVAADNNCSSADGGRIILSPRKRGVDVAGKTSNCRDHLSDGELAATFMADDREESRALCRVYIASWEE